MKPSPSQHPAPAARNTRRAFLHRVLSGTAALAAAGSAAPLLAALKSSRARNILIANAWHCINIGDIAHTPGLIHLLATFLPEVNVTLWPVPSVRPGQERELDPRVRRMLLAAFPRLKIISAGGTGQKPAVRPDLLTAIREADLFIVGSGGMHASPLDVWRATTDRPYGINGVTFGTIDRERAAVLAKAAFIYCRDSVSVGFLQQAGISGPHVGFGPDSTFALHLRDDERAEAFLRKAGLANKRFLCVVPRHRYSPYHTIYNDPNVSDRDREIDRINAEHASGDHVAARELIINWVRTTGLKVLACPEMTYGVPLAKAQLVDPMPADVKRNVVWKDSFWNADEAASVYTRALAVVSLDCHSPIIALAAGTPAIHLRVPTDNPHKSRMFADIGLPEWIHELEGMTGARLTEMVMDIHREPAVAAQKVERAMTWVRQRQAVTMASVRAALPA
ncbi:MAG: polysaccharide pyruvyl transferase family protein [Opitutaceae bacterium]|nr:polysaccharide pyruvyl transferase family protein [Opitutaceae bacterium]